LQPHAFQMFVKNVLRLTHGFAGGRRMIVNPSLQHMCWLASQKGLNENDFHFHFHYTQKDDFPNSQGSRILQLPEGCWAWLHESPCKTMRIGAGAALPGKIVASWPLPLLPHLAPAKASLASCSGSFSGFCCSSSLPGRWHFSGFTRRRTKHCHSSTEPSASPACSRRSPWSVTAMAFRTSMRQSLKTCSSRKATYPRKTASGRWTSHAALLAVRW